MNRTRLAATVVVDNGSPRITLTYAFPLELAAQVVPLLSVAVIIRVSQCVMDKAAAIPKPTWSSRRLVVAIIKAAVS